MKQRKWTTKVGYLFTPSAGFVLAQLIDVIAANMHRMTNLKAAVAHLATSAPDSKPSYFGLTANSARANLPLWSLAFWIVDSGVLFVKSERDNANSALIFAAVGNSVTSFEKAMLVKDAARKGVSIDEGLVADRLFTTSAAISLASGSPMLVKPTVAFLIAPLTRDYGLSKTQSEKQLSRIRGALKRCGFNFELRSKLALTAMSAIASGHAEVTIFTDELPLLEQTPTYTGTDLIHPGLNVIIAPGGYGKTTFVNNFLSTLPNTEVQQVNEPEVVSMAQARHLVELVAAHIDEGSSVVLDSLRLTAIEKVGADSSTRPSGVSADFEFLLASFGTLGLLAGRSVSAIVNPVLTDAKTLSNFLNMASSGSYNITALLGPTFDYSTIIFSRPARFDISKLVDLYTGEYQRRMQRVGSGLSAGLSLAPDAKEFYRKLMTTGEDTYQYVVIIDKEGNAQTLKELL